MISVVIRVKNEMPLLRRLIEALREQTYSEYEVIIVDNDSNDGSLEYAKENADKVITIPKNEFRYSKASNLGIENSSGEFIYLISAHCLPISNKLFENGTKILNSNSYIASVFGRNIYDPTTGNLIEKWIEKYDFGFWPKSLNIYNKYTPGLSQTSTCLMRSELLKKYPFKKMKIKGGEDAMWGMDMIKNGFVIAYDPSLDVYHSHGGSAFRTLKRYFFWSIEYCEVMSRSYFSGSPSGQQ